MGSWGAPGGTAGAAAAALEACKAGGWACSVCCWAEESESLSLSWGLGMLGDVLRLSWSMSLGSLLPSSLTLRLSELSPSPSDGELGRLISWVFVFLELVLSASSVSEATFSRWRLVFFSGDEASSFTFCGGKARGGSGLGNMMAGDRFLSSAWKLTLLSHSELQLQKQDSSGRDQPEPGRNKYLGMGITWLWEERASLITAHPLSLRPPEPPKVSGRS